MEDTDLIKTFYSYINNIEAQKEKIISILHQCNFTTNERSTVYTQIFEHCLEYDLDDKIIKFLIEIINTLIKKQSTKTKSISIKYIGSGSTSVVSQIGQYVLKLGKERITEAIPYDERILQPIIRKSIVSPKHSNNKNLYVFLEIQDLVDTHWYEGLDEEDINEQLYELYADLRKRGIIWDDIKKENAGKRLKTYGLPLRAKTHNTSVESCSARSKKLIVIDTDCLYTSKKLYNKNSNTLEYKFNKRYIIEQSLDKQELSK